MAFKDNVYRDIYDHFGTIMGDMACVMRERYDIPIDWITMHLDDGTTVSDDGIMGIVQHGPTFCVRLKDLAVETGIMYVSVRKIVDFARSLDDDFYMPLSVGGMAHIVELMDLCDMFPYKEYKTTTKSIMDAIKYDYEHYHRISWITEALRWLVHDKPILNVPVTMEWLAPNMEYPLEYLKGSYAVDSVMTMEEYSEHFDRMAGWVKKNITAIGFTRAFLDSLFFERSASYDKSRTVNSSNILQWDHILDMIPTIPPTLIRVINELFTGNHDDEDIMGFFIYSDMTSASKSGKKTYTY